MPKRFKSWRRALKRGHLALHNSRDAEGNIHSALCETYRRYGKPNYKKVVIFLGVTPKEKSQEEISQNN